mmetsp:Transcript_28754/g.69231  ORF Transcript_28754/g.69231 Transcript_28754/m.69231 type:complete len:451 (-) Transcript_28754:722-2074(-)
MRISFHVRLAVTIITVFMLSCSWLWMNVGVGFLSCEPVQPEGTHQLFSGINHDHTNLQSAVPPKLQSPTIFNSNTKSVTPGILTEANAAAATNNQCAWLAMKQETEQNFLAATPRISQLPPTIVHVHAHSSGGTSLTRLANRNGFRGEKPYHPAISSQDCINMMGTVVPFMWDYDRTCRWGDFRSEDRLQWLSKASEINNGKPIRYVNEEFHSMPWWEDIYGGGQFSFVAMFRSPVRRAARTVYESYTFLSDIIGMSPMLALKESLHADPDNLMTRLMSSDDTLMVLSHLRVQRDINYGITPRDIIDMVLKPVTERHYHRARINLDKLSAALLLEHVAGMLPLMAYKFNWTEVDPEHSNSIGSQVDEWIMNMNKTTKLLAELDDRNSYDVRLYNEAHIVAVRQLSEAVDACPQLDRCKNYVGIMKSTIDQIRGSEPYLTALNSSMVPYCS